MRKLPECSRLESNAAGLARWRLHELPDGFEEAADMAIMGANCPLQLLQLHRQLLMARGERSQFHERPHNRDVDLYGLLAM